MFYSAPIVERLDLFTLKTADGIFVLLDDFINKERTCENGFSEEVCYVAHFSEPLPLMLQNQVEFYLYPTTFTLSV